MKWLITSFDSRPLYRGGIATFSYELAKALAKITNQDVTLMAPACENDINFDKHNHFKTIRVKLPASAAKAIFPLRRYLKEYIKENSPDQVLHFLWHPEAVSSYFSRSTNYSIITHAVEVLEVSGGFRKKIRKILSPLKKLVYKKAKKVFAVSHFTTDLVHAKCGLEKNKINIMHPGVDLSEWKLTTRNNLPVQNFFTVTRLLDYKGVDKVIVALNRLKNHHQNWQYQIAGDGPDRKRLEKMVIDLNLSKYVKFLGAIDDDTLEKCLSNTDVFIMCTREDWKTPNVEGFGIVFLEAAACGIPSIGGKSGGISDAVVDGVTGWLVPPEDSNEIFKVLDFVIKNPDEVRKRGAAARARVEKKFQWKHVAEKLIKEYSNVRD
jgi:phosphatidylinositol alpha-1,6-mannosyltransferase